MPDLKNKSFTITAEAEIPASGAEGMIFTQGGFTGGWGLYIQQGKLVGLHNYVVSTESVPTGKVTLAMDFKSDDTGRGEGGTRRCPRTARISAKVASRRRPHSAGCATACDKPRRAKRRISAPRRPASQSLHSRHHQPRTQSAAVSRNIQPSPVQVLAQDADAEFCRAVPPQHFVDFIDRYPAWRSRSGCRSEKGAGGQQADPTRDAIKACCPDRWS
jgi:hypothetical protein